METNKCKVSVLCLAYNHGPYIREALEGFVSQKTDFPFEVWVNDDVSTDDTAQILREYAEKYPAIIKPVFQTVNQYSQDVCIEYEILLPRSAGEYIAFCEGDDCWTDPEKLQRQVDFLDAHPEYTACVHNTMGSYIGSDRPDELLFARGERDVPFETVIQGMSFCFHTSSMLIRREYVENAPDFLYEAQKDGFSDFPQAIWCAMHGKIRFLDRCMSLYRINSNAASWSAGVGGQYGKLKQFVTGEIKMFRSIRPLVDGQRAAAVDRILLEREYELLNIEGRVDEMVKPPYDQIHKAKGLGHRASTAVKRALPGLHRLYRKRKGYEDY